MPDEYIVTSTTGYIADICDIPLEAEEQTQNIIIDPDNDAHLRTTRRVVRARIVYNDDKSARRVDLALVHQRRHKLKEEWMDAEGFTLSKLKGGEEAKFLLDAKQTYELFNILKDLYDISAKGIPKRTGSYEVHHNIKANISAESIQEFVEFLNEGGEDVWATVTSAKLKIPAALAHHRVLEMRQQAVSEFHQHAKDKDWSEEDWQEFFYTNDWIFGHGLAYQFLGRTQGQPHYGGKDVTGSDGQRGDYLLSSKANVRFTVLVEIKRSDTLLLKPKIYRNQVYHLSDELTGGVSQLQSNCRTWVVEGSRQDKNRETLDTHAIYTYQPKGILVIGNTKELKDDIYKRATFELFRRNLANPEIITFDELYARAKFLVSHQSDTTGSEI